jgi:hypothetical protein
MAPAHQAEKAEEPSDDAREGPVMAIGKDGGA